MKKFLIAVILLIPVILILALNGANTIVAINTPDNPTKIEIRDKNNVIVKDGEVLELDLIRDDDFIIINIFPEITKNKNINKPEVTSNSTGELELKRIGNTNRYQIIPKQAGYVELILSAEANVSLRHKVSFMVRSNAITEVNILDSERRQLGASNIQSAAVYEFGETYYLDYYAKPFDALDYITPKWSFDPFGAAEVLNGHIIIKDRVKTKVSFTAYGKDGVPLQATTYIDFSKAIVDRTLVHTTESVDVNWIRNNIVFEEYRDSATITKLGGGKFSVEANDRKVIVTVVDNITSDIYFSDGIEKVYTNTSIPRLVLSKAENGEVIDLTDIYSDYYGEVRFVSSNTDILKVNENNGCIQPIKNGTCTVSAFILDKEYTKDIEVREVKEYFSLKHDYIDQARGIRQDRVWGTRFIEGGEDLTLSWDERLDSMYFVDTYDFFVKDDNADFDIIWEYDKEGVIEVERVYPIGDKNDIKIKFLDTGLGQSVTLTAYMSDGKNKIEHFKRSFTFKILNRPNAVNVTNAIGCRKLYIEKVLDMVYQSDIVLDGATNDATFFHTYGNIWGNGFTLSQNLETTNWAKWGLVRYDAERGDLINTKPDDEIIVDDLIIMTVPTLLDKETAKLASTGISAKEIHKTPVRFRYLQLKNCEIGMEIRQSANVKIEGSIIGDCGFLGIIYYNDWHENIDNDKLIIKNSVFTNSGGPSIMFLFNDLETAGEHQGKNILPLLKFEGDVRIYNWQDKQQFQRLFDVILASYFPDDSTFDGLRNILSPFWEKVMQDKRVENLFMWHKGKQYASVGVFTYGLTAKNDISKIQLGDKYVTKELPIKSESTSSFLDIFKLFASIASGSAVENLYESHLVGYDFSKGKPDVLPLEPVPASYEMYNSLTGGTAIPYS